MIAGEFVVLLGAFGQLTVVDLEGGEIVWQIDYQIEFGAEVPIWGFSGTPLIFETTVDSVARRLVLGQPGTPEASLVAFDLETGEIVWQVDGRPPGYSSFVLADVKGTQQLIGYDATTVGGWDLSGNRLWELAPESEGDFNVPTPILVERGLFLTTENNGSRLFEFNEDGTIISAPVATFPQLSPDTHTPVVVGEAICGVDSGFFKIDSFDLSLADELKGREFLDYCSIVSDGESKVLVVSQSGIILLMETDDEGIQVVSRNSEFQGADIISHPAISGELLLIRVREQICCVELAGRTNSTGRN